MVDHYLETSFGRRRYPAICGNMLMLQDISLYLSTGPVCSDPGRPPGGRQIATSYEEGSDVTFTCDRPGYVPYPSQITCDVNGGTASWSATTSPQCKGMTLKY